MLRLVIIFSCAAIISSKLNFIFPREDSGVDYNDYADYDYNNDTLWVLKFDEDIWDSLELRKGNAIDTANFKAHAAPMIDRYKKGKSTIVKEDFVMRKRKPVSTEEDPKEIKTKLLKMINKFLIYKDYHPNKHQLGNYTEPPLTIYFKGPFTCILVQHDFRHWLYFVPPPSPLPWWFYKQHRTTVTGVVPDVVPIPDDVTLDLYPALLSLMEKILLS